MGFARTTLIWAGLAIAIGVPFVIAAKSPLLAWREPVYIVAGLAGVAAMGLLLLQPLLAKGDLPGFQGRRGRKLHALVGIALVASVLVHILGLWATSPPDVIDALLFRSPTPFSIWGVIAMWAVFAAATLAALRKHLGVKPVHWRRYHIGLATVIVIGSVIHALLIEGTMGTLSKIGLCVLVVIALLRVVIDLKVLRLNSR